MLAHAARYERLVPTDLEAILRNAPIIYLPLGALEWHDNHLPLGTDGLIAHGLCTRLAGATGGAVLPAQDWSIHGADRDPPYVWDRACGTLALNDAALWENLVRAQVRALDRQGWRVMVLVAGHVGQPERDILARLARDLSAPGARQVLYVYPYRYAPGDHAGRFETNLVLALCPEQVRAAPSAGNPFCRCPSSAASPTEGRAAVDTIVREAARSVRAALTRSGFHGREGLPLCDSRALDRPWAARWIGPAGEPEPNAYVLARARIEVRRRPEAALLRIAADARYAVYVNGTFVGNGPARGTHRRYFADGYDVAALLREGTNWVAAEVHCRMIPSYMMAPQRPALLAEIDGLAASGAAWQVRRDPSQRADAPVYTKQVGASEWRDLRAEPAGWMTGQDGDAGWAPAAEFGTAADFGGRVTVARPIGGLARDRLMPARLVEAVGVPDAPAALDSPEYAALMADEPHLPLRPPGIENPGALLRPDGIATVWPQDGNLGVCLLLDFEDEVLGNLVLDLEAGAGTVLDVAHGEQLTDGRLLPKRRGIEYRFADRFVLREGRQVVAQRLQARGLRYLQLVFRNLRQPVRLHGLRIVSRLYAREPAAEFSCDNALLTRLWGLCAETVRRCASDTFMDCPWREQALWINDQAMTSLYYLALTGDPVFAAHNLRVGADAALPNGLIPAVYPSERATRFPSLPALWTFTLDDYYRYTADRGLLADLLPVMEQGLSLYETWRADDGLVPDQDGMLNFIDWGYPSGLLRGKTAALNMLVAAAYRRAAALEAAAGRAARETEYAGKSQAVLDALDAALWDDAAGRYRDCTAPAGAPTSSQHPLAVGLACGLLDGPRRAAALGSLLDPGLIPCELYFQHFVLVGLARHGRLADALGVVRTLWGEMVQAGSPTVWESRQGARAFHGLGSLCHAFSCAPLYLLQAFVLGVEPLDPGFATFRLAPCVRGLGAVSGSVPTPHGPIAVRACDTASGDLDVHADVPPGTRARLPDGRVLGPGSHRVRCAPAADPA